MARIFRHKYRTPGGDVRETGNYYIGFVDHEGRERSVAAFTDEKVTALFAAKLERLVACRIGGESPDGDLVLWLENMPDRIRRKLGEWGVIDPRRAAAGRSLEEHIADYAESLQAEGIGDKHVASVRSRLVSLFTDCGFSRWSDIQAETIKLHLSAQRKAGKIGIRTSNHYIQAAKQFCRWMIRQRRASESPVAHMQRMNAAVDVKRKRRALSADESRRLVQAAQNGPEVNGLAGTDRAILYRLALETGLRWSELFSLRACNFVLAGPKPYVTVPAAYSKHKREDTLPLRLDMAAALREYFAMKLPGAAAFPTPQEADRGARMVKTDCEAAGIVYHDPERGYADFHALRHTFITRLGECGVHPRTAQSLARHSSIDLTMNTYTHVEAVSQSSALDALPDLTAPVGNAASATGTDDVTLPETLPEAVPFTASQCEPVRTTAPENPRNCASVPTKAAPSRGSPDGGRHHC